MIGEACSCAARVDNVRSRQYNARKACMDGNTSHRWICGRWASPTAGRLLWAVLALLTTALFAVPLWIVLVCDGDYTVFATESLSYRYFFCERVQAGEGGTAWLPQGQLLAVFQHVIL